MLQAFSNAGPSIHEAFESLGSDSLVNNVKDALEEQVHVCMLYPISHGLMSEDGGFFVENRLDRISSHRQKLPFLKVPNDHSISASYGSPPLNLIPTYQCLKTMVGDGKMKVIYMFPS